MSDDKRFSGTGQDERPAFNSLIDKYNASLNAYAYHIVGSYQAAEEIVQDVFVYLWLNRKKIDFETSIRNLLYVSTRNLSYTHLRTVKRYEDRLKGVEPEGEIPDAHMIEEEAVRLLREAIAKLPPRTAEVICLSLEGLKQEEIAERMNVTLSNIKNLKAIGIKKLKELLDPLHFLLLLSLLHNGT